MVENDVFLLTPPDAVFHGYGGELRPLFFSHSSLVRLCAFVAHAETYKPYNQVVSRHLGGPPADADPVSWGSLPGYRNVSSLDRKVGFEVYSSGDIEYDGPVAALAQGGPQCTGAAVGEAGHMDHLASAASCGEHPAAFGAGECAGGSVFIFRGRNLEVGIFDLGFGSGVVGNVRIGTVVFGGSLNVLRPF